MSKFFVRDNELHSGVHGLSKSMFSNNLEMIVERGFPLLRKINSLITSMREMGMMTKLNSDFIYNKTILIRIKSSAESYNKESTNKNESHENVLYEDEDESKKDDSRVVLTMEHLEGGFTLLLAGYIISLIIFIFELLTKVKFIKKTIKFLKKLGKSKTKKKREVKINIIHRSKNLKIIKKNNHKIITRKLIRNRRVQRKFLL
jgi:hypothetical protein